MYTVLDINGYMKSNYIVAVCRHEAEICKLNIAADAKITRQAHVKMTSIAIFFSLLELIPS